MRIDESEIYQDMKQYSQNTRAENIRISIEYLEKHNIKFISKTKNKVNLVIIDTIIFDPGTGHWCYKTKPGMRFGVRNLVKHIKEISKKDGLKQMKLW